MSLCIVATSEPTTGPTGRATPAHARACAIDGWRHLPPPRRLACLKCEIRGGHDLRELAKLEPLLYAASVEPARGVEDGIPLGVNAFDLRLPGRLHAPLGPEVDQVGYRPIASALAEWVLVWKEWGAPPGHVRSYGSVWSLTRWFADRLSWAYASLDPIGDFAAEVRRQLYAVRGVLGINDRPERLSLPCVACGETALVRRQSDPHEGSEELSTSFVECGECDWWWDEPEYAKVKSRQLRAQIPDTVMLTAAEIAIARPGVLASNVRDWKRRKRITPIPGPWGARTVYILAEVDDLIDRTIAARLVRHQAQQAVRRDQAEAKA